jgi:hypothetical protein
MIAVMNHVLPLLIALAARESALPVAGQWRGSSSTVILTNTASRPARVTLSWITGAPRHLAPPNIELMLHGNETRAVEVGQEILRGREAAGGLTIVADGDVVARAIIRGRPEGPGAAFDAVPLRDAIGTGESTTIAGVAGDGGYRLFAAETKGHPVHFSAVVVAGDEVRGEKRYYLEPLHQLTIPIEREFRIASGEAFTLVMRAMNGSGRLVAAGAELTASQDLVPFGMHLRSKPRRRINAAEIAAYGFVTVALVAAAFYARKRPR